MKHKNVKLEWNVLYWNQNNKKIEKYNILNDEIRDILYKEIKNKKIVTYGELKERFDRWASYYYWSKAECEMLIGNLFSKNIDELTKIDMYKQIEINEDRILEYIINKMQLDL